jgi:hypothetical protein
MNRSLQLMLATLGIAAFLGTAAPAGAATLASGVLETRSGTQIRCWLANVSTQPMTYTMCSVNVFTGADFICESGVVNPGAARFLIGGSEGGVFYCRFNVNNKSAARATASLKSFLNGTTFAVIDAR